MARWHEMSDDERAVLLADVVRARRHTLVHAVSLIVFWGSLPVLVLAASAARRLNASMWVVLPLGYAMWLVAAVGAYRLCRRAPSATAVALEGVAGGSTIVRVSTFTNDSNTAFTRVRFADGSRERLDDHGLADRLVDAVGATRGRPNSLSIW